MDPIIYIDPLGLAGILPGPIPIPILLPNNPAQEEADNTASKALTKWWHDTFSDDDNCPPCTPPAGEKYNIEVHTERHEGRGLTDGAHGCMALTGSPVHWHYDVNNQNPVTCECYPREHVFGGCGVP